MCGACSTFVWGRRCCACLRTWLLGCRRQSCRRRRLQWQSAGAGACLFRCAVRRNICTCSIARACRLNEFPMHVHFCLVLFATTCAAVNKVNKFVSVYLLAVSPYVFVRLLGALGIGCSFWDLGHVLPATSSHHNPTGVAILGLWAVQLGALTGTTCSQGFTGGPTNGALRGQGAPRPAPTHTTVP